MVRSCDSSSPRSTRCRITQARGGHSPARFVSPAIRPSSGVGKPAIWFSRSARSSESHASRRTRASSLIEVTAGREPRRADHRPSAAARVARARHPGGEGSQSAPPSSGLPSPSDCADRKTGRGLFASSKTRQPRGGSTQSRFRPLHEARDATASISAARAVPSKCVPLCRNSPVQPTPSCDPLYPVEQPLGASALPSHHGRADLGPIEPTSIAM